MHSDLILNQLRFGLWVRWRPVFCFGRLFSLITIFATLSACRGGCFVFLEIMRTLFWLCGCAFGPPRSRFRGGVGGAFFFFFYFFFFFLFFFVLFFLEMSTFSSSQSGSSRNGLIQRS
jgi:hypothetical protein